MAACLRQSLTPSSVIFHRSSWHSVSSSSMSARTFPPTTHTSASGKLKANANPKQAVGAECMSC